MEDAKRPGVRGAMVAGALVFVLMLLLLLFALFDVNSFRVSKA